MMKSLKIVILFLSILTFAFGSQATAAGKSGDGNAIPYPKKEWKGVQGKTLADSKPDFIGQPKAPAEAPNVVIIMLDDGGYSSATSYGGVMKTPTFDRIGDEGIRYNAYVCVCGMFPHPGLAVDRVQYSPDRHRHHIGVCHRLSGVQLADRLHHPIHCQDFNRQRICHGRIRQMAQYPHGRSLAGRSL